MLGALYEVRMTVPLTINKEATLLPETSDDLLCGMFKVCGDRLLMLLT